MGVSRLEELVAYQRAKAVKEEVYAVLRTSRAAERDVPFRNQLLGAISGVESNIAEGWGRFRRREMCQFLRYALASLLEAETRLLDGVSRRHYSRAACERALHEIRRCTVALTRLRQSLERFDNGQS